MMITDSDFEKSAQQFKLNLEARRDALRRELELTEHLLEGIGKWASSRVQDIPVVNPTNTEARANGETVVAPQNDATEKTGLPKGLTRRQAITQIIAELDSEKFEPQDVREKYVERYPQGDSKHLSPNISGILKQMSERGEITRLGRKGNSPNDPYVYQKVNDIEERLGLDT